MSKPVLYIDVDDTLIAGCHAGSGFDLRPGVLTQLRVLTNLFQCYWLTYWGLEDITSLIDHLYGGGINQGMHYAYWDKDHPQRKAGHVLAPGMPEDFYWLEDPLCQEEIEALKVAGKIDRYIRVEPQGNWAFLDAVNELFRRAGIDDKAIWKAGGKPEWFSKEAILAHNPAHENLVDSLSMVKMIASSSTIDDAEKVKQIQTYIQHQLDTVY